MSQLVRLVHVRFFRLAGPVPAAGRSGERGQQPEEADAQQGLHGGARRQ